MKALPVLVALVVALGTTTAQNPTPTPTPVPTTTLPPEPTAGTWSVKDGNTTCIMAKLGARFTFNYTGADDKTYTMIQDLPSNQTQTAATGSCKNTTQSITLTYKKNNGSCAMTLNFIKNKKKKFSVNKVNVNFAKECFAHPPKQDPVTASAITNGTLFTATVGQSYMCNSEQDVNLANPNMQDVLVLVQFSDVQLQAFTNSTDFKDAEECPQDAETSNIVPIAVGAALAALVLIVLIAYLISRNRSQRGYESV